MSTKLNQNPDMIKVMEDDLKAKANEAVETANLTLPVMGVFDLDHLEQMMEAEVTSMAIGVGFVSTEALRKEDSGTFNPMQSTAAKGVLFTFMIVLALPAQGELDERFDATRLLTVLRQRILGTPIGEERSQRTWNFVRERPETGASTRTLLYYSQVWQVAMQNLGNTVS